jgi:hypothetical protein
MERWIRFWGSKIQKREPSRRRQNQDPCDRINLFPSTGEINFLYWYIQGMIMDPDVRWELRRGWGFCERHAWVTLLVEAAFRPGFLHGPSLVYEDILGRALAAFNISGTLRNSHLRLRLRAKGPCMLCKMGFGPESKASVRKELVETGRNPSALLSFALETREYWSRTVCGRCEQTESGERCRRHLLEDGAGNSLTRHREFLRDLHGHLVIYARSFCWDFRNTEKSEDKAALISAVGWCSGWGPLLHMIKELT